MDTDVTAMTTNGACDRIEAALARIERALAAAAPDHDLQRRHDQLREAAASSLLMIDALIATHEGETPR